ncbi:MAG TPA: hypothetical protein PKN96_06400 [Flavobacterium sp.]|uniref:hypothetical protein n=1 Tax=Flavobacterium sp. TaxID=239 RepID=UPI002C541F75|nr:hypothetical protein [Flavobacterium sp.]HNP32904.1 hypothetical protein [Flavobacterium sp.]
MEKHFHLDDSEFEKAFENCTIDPVIFTHEAHLRLAWIHITKYGEENAIGNICKQLMVFVEFVGANGKYNKTLTVAAIKAVHHFIKKSKSDTFDDFITEFPHLKYNFKELMNFHYKIDIFNSMQAKTEFLEPDLVPFD